MLKTIPVPALNRLCLIYRILGELFASGVTKISSKGIGALVGEGAHNVRKDINYLGEIGSTGSGYVVEKLRDYINEKLSLEKPRNACIVGLGRIGSSVLSYERFQQTGFSIVAGFDSDINLLDTIRTKVPVYPTHRIDEIVRKKDITIAVVAVPANAAQEIVEKLIAAGVRGIVNYSPAILSSDRNDVFINNMDLVNEFTKLSALITLHDSTQHKTPKEALDYGTSI